MEPDRPPQAAGPGARRDAGPLAGVVVADLSRVLAGPYCTMLLADMGATVIKVEGLRGDDTRTWAPPWHEGESTYFLSVNRNKYSIVLDFADDGDREVVEELVGRADVLVENFRPGGLRRFGLDYPSLSRRHPGLVYASITGFGSEGGGDLPGYDLLAQAVSGLMEVTGLPEGPPTKAGVAVVDVITGLHATAGILAGLHARRTSGRGQHVEVNLLSSALSGLVNQSAAYAIAGVVPRRLGNAHPSLAPYEPLATRDESIVVAVGNDAQFSRLCAVLDLAELAQDVRFATMSARNAHRDELRRRLESRLRLRDRAEWFALLRAASVPCAPILDVAGGVDFAESLGLAPIVVAGHEGRAVAGVRHPIAFSDGDLDYSQPPPTLDGDREAILRWLGS